MQVPNLQSVIPWRRDDESVVAWKAARENLIYMSSQSAKSGVDANKLDDASCNCVVLYVVIYDLVFWLRHVLRL